MRRLSCKNLDNQPGNQRSQRGCLTWRTKSGRSDPFGQCALRHHVELEFTPKVLLLHDLAPADERAQLALHLLFVHEHPDTDFIDS